MGEMHITGTEVSYLYICHRKLWLFHHGIRMEAENTHVQIGRLIQEETFSRHPKEIPLWNSWVCRTRRIILE
jgi:CRISPR-associated exonuclease Cas4